MLQTIEIVMMIWDFEGDRVISSCNCHLKVRLSADCVKIDVEECSSGWQAEEQQW